MEDRAHVPKFGDWTEDAPFTIVFDKASRKKRDTNMSNPNEYPEMNQSSSLPTQNRNYRQEQPPNNHNVTRPRHERFSSRDETEFRPSPAHHERNNRVRAPPTSETYNYQSYGNGGRSVGNQSETNRRQPYDPAPIQPRPIRNLRGQSSERVATIPPFPGTGSEDQSYTLIFDKVKEERKQSARSYNGTTHSTPTRPINYQNQPLPSSPKGCCFPPWSRKGSY